MKKVFVKLQNKIKKLPIHPSFLPLFLWFVLTGNFLAFGIFIGVVMTHEFGHYFVAKKLGYKLDSFFLAPYGVSLSYKEQVFENSDEAKIALAGPVVNIVLSFLCIGLWWAFPESYNYTDVFVKESFMLALFNLLPAYPMDGGRVMLSCLCKLMTREKAIKLIKIFNLVFAFIFFGLFVYSCTFDFNPTFALASIFLIIGVIQTGKESKYKIMALLKKKNKNYSRPLILYISSEVTLGNALKHIQQNRYTVFYVDFNGEKTKVIDEILIMKLATKFPLYFTFNMIFIKE